MKKYFLVVLAFVSVLSFSSCEEEDENEYASLESADLSAPVVDSINAYIDTHHPNATIVEVEIEAQYIEVELNNNRELKFDLDGSFLVYDDDNDYASLESANLSAPVVDSINAYIDTHHPNATIVEVEIEAQYIEVELDNKRELKFDLDGAYLAYDN
jgi:L-fucose mutarotase/ribose pyranase (RbsD/FucU family)